MTIRKHLTQTLISVWLQENHTFRAVTEGSLIMPPRMGLFKIQRWPRGFQQCHCRSQHSSHTQLAPLPQGFLACNACLLFPCLA